MINAYKRFWNNYVNFSGVSSRSDYWLAWLMNTIIYLIAIVILGVYVAIKGVNGTYHDYATTDGVSFSFQFSGILLPVILWVIFIYSLAILLPSFSISIRRLRDAGFHWSFIFLNLIPTIGSIVLLILHCLPTCEEFTDQVKEKSSNPEELEKWYQLKEKNAITQTEYDLKKKELL